MKRVLTIVGRFAFGGWAIITGVIAAMGGIMGMAQGFEEVPFLLLTLLGYSVFGLIGGAVVGIIAAALDRLIKVPLDKARSTENAAPNDPAVWPPAPKPPA